jgi:regulator of cell morphogenesis and NO signaling
MDLRERTLGEIAAEHPAATRVFLRHRLDFCCGGKRSLELACVQAGLDATEIERELEKEGSRADDASSWQVRSSAELADHIEAQYHQTLRRDVPALIQAARKVEKVHAEKPAVPAGLADELTAFWDEMQHHMRKEEEILFPLLRRGAHGGMVEMPVRVMEQEHDEHAVRLARIRELTNRLQAPSYACSTWRALYAGLAALEQELMLHIHLENNILFRRALAEA